MAGFLSRPWSRAVFFLSRATHSAGPNPERRAPVGRLEGRRLGGQVGMLEGWETETQYYCMAVLLRVCNVCMASMTVGLKAHHLYVF